MSAQAFRCLGCAALMSAAISVPLRTAAAEPPHLQTHQSYVEDVMRATTLDVGDPLAVFAFVLDSLPERVKIYPTEGYFYFNFVHNGVPYAGNIRLDASNRDDGKVNFAYFEQTTEWRDDTPGKFEVLDAGKGVALEKMDNFHYRLTFRGKSVVFELNDLSNVTPPAAALAPHETFIGPIFDDSAIRFFLIYNAAIKNFIYVLDETAKVADELVPSKHSERMLTGKRTGFVFYRDHKRDRKILIGVYAENVRVNNYFDGPFDQLPDPYIKGETLRNAIIDVDPTKKGKIDRFGGSADGTVRFMIAPYALYEEERELYGIDRCATRSRHSSEARYYKCFVAK